MTLLTTAVVAWTTPAGAADRIVGLLELPQVFGNGPCARFKPEEIRLYASPNPRDRIGVVRVDRYWTFHADLSCEGLTVRVHRGPAVSELPTEEFAYEMQGAIVLEHRQPWFRIRLNDGSAWVRASNPAHFHSLESLLQDGLVSLTDAWDGTLAASPGGPLLPVPHHPNRQVIGYLTPVLTLVEIPVGPGENAEDIRKRHPGIGMGSVSGRDGVIRLLYYHHGREVEARARPDRQAPVVERFINDHARLLRGRDGTSPLPVFVFDRVPGWFQVARRREGLRPWQLEERLWIEDAGAWEFQVVTDQSEREELASASWGPDYSDVRVLGFRLIEGRLWVEVEPISHSICEPYDEQPQVLGRGWMPVHSASGEPMLWFASRGC